MKIDGIETAFGDVELLVDGVPIPVESVTYAKA
jgi:hypothetical protein